MPREPQNIGEVLAGSAGEALEQLGQLYPQYQAGKRQALLNAFSMQLKLEAAESDRQVGRSRMAHLAALTRLADLKGEEAALKMANFLPGIEKLELETKQKKELLDYSIKTATEAVSAPGEPGEGVVIPSGVKIWERPTPEVTPEETGIAAAETEAAKFRRLQEIGVPTGRPKTLSAKDQWYKSYLEREYSPEEAAERFASFIDPETGPEEKREYYRILRSQVGGAFFNVKDPEALTSAQQFAAKSSLWLPEANAPLRDVLEGLRRRLEAGKIDQTQYDDAIRQINASLGVENVEQIFGR